MEEDRAKAITDGKSPRFLDRFPIADYDDVWERAEGLVDGIEGIESIFDRIQFSKPDLDKWLPGYKDFWAWAYDPENPFNFDDLVIEGPNAVPTYAEQWQEQANFIVQQQLTSLGSDT
jgi:multiple sugar transport system substrate-binding protein